MSKTKVEGDYGHAFHKKSLPHEKKCVKELAPSSWDLLNGQGVQRNSCLQKLDIRFEGAMVKVFVEAVQKCVRVKRNMDARCPQEVR